MITPEQRIIDILIHRLGIKPFFAEEIAKDILKALASEVDNTKKEVLSAHETNKQQAEEEE